MSALDADALATLTPEEREAIEGSDIRDDDLDAMKKIASESDASDDDDGDQDDADDGDDDAAPIEGKTAPAEAAAEDAAEDEAPARQAVPRYEAQLPSDYDDQIKTLKDRDAELRQKFKDGEIDIDERDAGLAELGDQREQLLVARAKAEISQEMNQQTAAQQWQNAINRAMVDFAKPENGGIDYRKDNEAAQALDEEVKALAQMQRHANKPMEWFLAEAHKRVMLERGQTPPPAAKKDTLAEAKAARKPPVDAAPKTLAQVPGSDGPGDVGSEFADVDQLDGWELEQAIARMSPTQRAKYLKG